MGFNEGSLQVNKIYIYIGDIGKFTHHIVLLYGKYLPVALVVFVVHTVFFSHLFWTSSSLDIPAGVAQEEGHTGFLIHLPSAVHAFIFFARRIQPFLSLVDREVESCVLTIQSFSTCWALFHFILFF